MTKKYFLITFIFSFFLALSVVHAEDENKPESTETALQAESTEETSDLGSALNLELDMELDESALNNLTIEDLDKEGMDPGLIAKIKIGFLGLKYLMSEGKDSAKDHLQKHKLAYGIPAGTLTAAVIIYLIVHYWQKKNNIPPTGDGNHFGA